MAHCILHTHSAHHHFIDQSLIITLSDRKSHFPVCSILRFACMLMVFFFIWKCMSRQPVINLNELTRPFLTIFLFFFLFRFCYAVTSVQVLAVRMHKWIDYPLIEIHWNCSMRIESFDKIVQFNFRVVVSRKVTIKK